MIRWLVAGWFSAAAVFFVVLTVECLFSDEEEE